MEQQLIRPISEMKKNKKGQFGLMINSVISLVLLVVILVLGLVIVQKLRDTNTVTTDVAYQAANKSLTGLGTFGDFISIVVLAVVTSVIIGLLLALFGGRARVR